MSNIEIYNQMINELLSCYVAEVTFDSEEVEYISALEFNEDAVLKSRNTNCYIILKLDAELMDIEEALIIDDEYRFVFRNSAVTKLSVMPLYRKSDQHEEI